MTKLKLSALALTLIATLGMATASAIAKDWKTITFGTEGGYEPWNLTKPDGSLDGFEIDLTKDLCKRIGAECKFITTDWDGAIASLQAGKFDVLVDSVSITDERKGQIDFSIPYTSTPTTFVATKAGAFAKLPGTGTTIKLAADGSGDKATIDALKAALKGKTIGVQTATVYAKFLTDTFKGIADIREYKTSTEHDLDVQAGRIDIAFDDATVIQGALAKKENADLTITGPQIGGAIWGEGQGYGLQKGNAELKAKLDGAIKAALADGTIKALSVKWFGGLDVTP